MDPPGKVPKAVGHQRGGPHRNPGFSVPDVPREADMLPRGRYDNGGRRARARGRGFGPGGTKMDRSISSLLLPIRGKLSQNGQVVAELSLRAGLGHADPPLTSYTLQVKKIATASPYNNIIVVSEDLAQ